MSTTIKIDWDDNANQKTKKISIESPENVEMGGKIDSIRVCSTPAWKAILRYISYVCSGFIIFLLQLWMPKFSVAITVSDSDLDKADSIVVYGADDNIEVVPLIEEVTSTKTLKVFYYRLFKYYFDDRQHVFKPCQFKIESLTYSEIHEKYGQGLESDNVKDNGIFFGRNMTDIPKKSCLTLMVEEVLSPFYVFQVYSIIIWALDDYVLYAVIIVVFSAGSIAITLYETIQTRNKLRDMSYYEIPVNVYRKVNGEPEKFTVNSSELVPGDLIEIPEAVLMPCDAILLNGSCIMNESMLTGESIPVVKNSLPYGKTNYNNQEDKQYTLYAGTKCIQSRYFNRNAVLGLVTLTGFATVKGELIRTMLFPKPTDFKFYSDSFKFISILAVMAVAGFIYDLPSWIRSGEEDIVTMIIIKASEIVTVTVPPALPTCMQIGISVALSRLKKKRIYCISPNKINETGRVNVMCFDKTGTLTEDGLDLLGVRSVFFDKNTNKLNFTKLIQETSKLSPPPMDSRRRTIELTNYMSVEGANSEKGSIYKNTGLLPSEQLLEIMAVCHSLTYVKETMIGDPLDIKMFESTKWILEENDQQKYDRLVLAVVKPPPSSYEQIEGVEEVPEKAIGIIRRFEFSSKLQRMSVVVKNLQETKFKVHIKGSPEKVRELCRPESVPENFHHILEKYTEEGYRVLAYATKSIGYNYKRIMSMNREDFEVDFTFIGFLIMENKLKPITTSVIDLLHSADVKTVMVTGDNALTAISVARQCNIVGHHQRVFFGDISEKKVNDKNMIIWKDFEFSERRLDNNLEPEPNNSMLEQRESGISSNKNLHSKTHIGVSGEATESLLHSHTQIDFRQRHHSLHDKSHKGEHSPQRAETKELTLSARKMSESSNIIDVNPPFFDIESHEDYCIAVTGKAFSFILHEAEVNNSSHHRFILQKLLRRCLVFARMHPDEKALMIKHMMSNPNNVVGMCGDGANDVGALKTANVGVSLSEAEASIAAPFTSNIQDISCIPTVLREGKSGLSTSYQAFKYMALYSIIQFTTVTLLYNDLIELTNWAYYHIDILIILILSATMAMSKSYPRLTKFKPTGRLVSVQILTSVIGQGFIQIVFQIITYGILKRQDWYDPKDCENNFETQNACYENTSLYTLTIYQYWITALAFIVGKPFRKPFYTNFWFTFSFIGLLGTNLLVTYNPFKWSFIDNQFTDGDIEFSTQWRNIIIIIAAANCLVSLLWEGIVVPIVTTAGKNHREKKQKIENKNESFYHPPEL